MSSKILGFVETHNQCDCCGKTGLKGTYAVETENGELYHMGSRCVMNKEGFTKEKEIKDAIKEFRNEIITKAREIFRELGGYDIQEQMRNLEAFTPEHETLWEKADELREISVNKIREQYQISDDQAKYINF